MATCQPTQPLRTRSWRISARFGKASSIEPSSSFQHRVPKLKERPRPPAPSSPLATPLPAPGSASRRRCPLKRPATSGRAGSPGLERIPVLDKRETCSLGHSIHRPLEGRSEEHTSELQSRQYLVC